MWLIVADCKHNQSISASKQAMTGLGYLLGSFLKGKDSDPAVPPDLEVVVWRRIGVQQVDAPTTARARGL